MPLFYSALRLHVDADAATPLYFALFCAMPLAMMLTRFADTLACYASMRPAAMPLPPRVCRYAFDVCALFDTLTCQYAAMICLMPMPDAMLLMLATLMMIRRRRRCHAITYAMPYGVMMLRLMMLFACRC